MFHILFYKVVFFFNYLNVLPYLEIFDFAVNLVTAFSRQNC